MPTTSKPCSTSSAAVTALSTPPDMASTTRQSRAGLSRPRAFICRASPAHHVARRLRQLDGEAVELLGHDDLAAEARGLRQAESEVEHVLFVLACLLQELVPFRIDDDVTGRAGERALAGALDVDAMLVRDLQHREAERRVHLAARPVALDESHFRHGAILAVRIRHVDSPDQSCRCEERGSATKQSPAGRAPLLAGDCFASLAMTAKGWVGNVGFDPLACQTRCVLLSLDRVT